MYHSARTRLSIDMRLVKPPLALAALAVLAVTLTGCLAIPSFDRDRSLPAGYSDKGDGAASRWADDDEMLECEGTLTLCGTLMVYAYERCDVYVRVNVLDADGTVIGYTNALGGDLRPGDYAKVMLRTYDEGAAGMRLTDLNCY